LVHFDQAAILDPISHLLPVKVDPLPMPIPLTHGIPMSKEDSNQCDNTAVMPTASEQSSAAEQNATPTETLVGFSDIQAANQLQESVGDLVSQPEGQPKLDHF
jgi:hypothetical protein